MTRFVFDTNVMAGALPFSGPIPRRVFTEILPWFIDHGNIPAVVVQFQTI